MPLRQTIIEANSTLENPNWGYTIEAKQVEELAAEAYPEHEDGKNKILQDLKKACHTEGYIKADGSIRLFARGR